MDKKELFKKNVHDYISLVASYLNKKTSSDFHLDDDNFKFFLKLSKNHSLTALLYKAIKDTKVEIDSEKLKGLEEYYLSVIRRGVLFEKERKELYEYLNSNQIDFLPLKGLILKEYYLDSYTREFADNDILFDNSNSDKIKKYFTSKGYLVELYKKSNHDVYQKKPFFNFEMHRDLFQENEDYPKYISYFKNYLKESSVKEGYEHVLSKENFYIYFTAHSYKHFHLSGCGIRTLIDYYLYLKNNDLDFNYINEELNKLDLLDFSNNISKLSLKLFDNELLNEEEEETLLFIASSGTYGTLKNRVNKGVKEKGKFGYFISRVFPPYSFYKTAYPWAYKTIILIPVAWTCRLFRVIFKNPKRASTELKMISKTKKEDQKEN